MCYAALSFILSSLDPTHPRVTFSFLYVTRMLTNVASLRLRIEVAVKQILSGIKIKTNASVANPEALAWFEAWAAKQS